MPKETPVWTDKLLESMKKDLKESIAKGSNESIAKESKPCEQEVGSGVWTAEEVLGAKCTEGANVSGVANEELQAKIAGRYEPSKDVINKADTPNEVPHRSGMFHTETVAPSVTFKKARNEKVIVKGNAYIVFGSDRPDSNRSGKGRLGTPNASTIDIVVGRASSAKVFRKNLRKQPRAMVDNLFAADAARIYISQLTDVDDNFGIASDFPGSIGSIRDRSAIALKADGIRMIGREGIKIVTGKMQGVKGAGPTGELNSLGGKMSQPAPKIELIAGNKTANTPILPGIFNQGEVYNTMQGVARGENVVYALRDLHKYIDQMWSSMFQFMLYQISFNAALGPALSPLPAAPIVAGIASATTTAHVNFSVNPLYHVRTNLSTWNANYLQISGYRWIASRNVVSN